MKTKSRPTSEGYWPRKTLLSIWGDIERRFGWFIDNITISQTRNMVLATGQYLLKTPSVLSWPLVLKIDISPLCNLGCTICVHRKPLGNKRLELQKFHSKQYMSIEQYKKIIDEVAGKTSAVSLYLLGDPLVHPDLCKFARITRDAGINVHISTHFSFKLSDQRIADLANSGITHFTVCVDGLSQEAYELTRKGGQIELVLSNLRRLCEYIRQNALKYPKIEVQYIKYQHNLHELKEATHLFREMGVEQVTHFWGDLNNYTDLDPGTYHIYGPNKPKIFPQCYWPYFHMTIKYNGDVLPCSNYRYGERYTQEDTPRSLGNVFTSGVKAVWQNMQYIQARRMASNPKSACQSGDVKDHFCYGCPSLFATDVEKNRRNAAFYTIEEVNKEIEPQQLVETKHVHENEPPPSLTTISSSEATGF